MTTWNCLEAEQRYGGWGGPAWVTVCMQHPVTVPLRVGAAGEPGAAREDGRAVVERQSMWVHRNFLAWHHCVFFVRKRFSVQGVATVERRSQQSGCRSHPEVDTQPRPPYDRQRPWGESAGPGEHGSRRRILRLRQHARSRVVHSIRHHSIRSLVKKAVTRLSMCVIIKTPGGFDMAVLFFL